MALCVGLVLLIIIFFDKKNLFCVVFAGHVSSLSLASFGVSNLVVGALIFVVSPSSSVGWIWPLCQNWGFCSISIPRLFAG